MGRSKSKRILFIAGALVGVALFLCGVFFVPGMGKNHLRPSFPLNIASHGSLFLAMGGRPVPPQAVNIRAAGTVPVSALNGTVIGAAAIVACVCAIFLFLMYRQRKTLARNQSMLEYMAYTDPLTGGANYAKFQTDAADFLESAGDRPLYIYSLDIKHFKTINDIWGAKTGDMVIRLLFQCLAAAAPPDSLFCRVSADNFAGILPFAQPQKLEEWFHTVRRALSSQDFLSSSQMHLDISAGFYLVEKNSEDDSVSEIVNRAVIAKKAAKEMSGSAFAFFSHKMSEEARRQAELESAGKGALQNGEICFFLQPKVGIQDCCRIVGAEVLARWRHPAFGWVDPAEFVPVFEKSGMISKLDRVMFRQACAWYRAYLDGGMPPINLAINVSRLGMTRGDFLEYYSAVRDEYGLSGSTLELEFTESVVMEDYDLFTHMVNSLREKGFVCSIDDFGSGYSSLNVLKNLPINVLKLDAAFFRDSNDIVRERTVIAHFINMARELHIRVIAEGVETKEQVDFLRAAGCDVVQGYIFARPMPPEEFEALQRKTGGVLPPPGAPDERGK